MTKKKSAKKAPTPAAKPAPKRKPGDAITEWLAGAAANNKLTPENLKRYLAGQIGYTEAQDLYKAEQESMKGKRIF